MRPELRMRVSVPVRALEQSSRNQRFDEEPVNGLVGRINQRERRQVDLLIPKLEKAVVDTQGFSERRINYDARSTRAFRQPFRELSRRH